MLRRIALMVSALLVLTAFGCGDILNQQRAKDRDLGKVVNDNLQTSPTFEENFRSFTYVEPGKYKLETKGLTDAQKAGAFAYNAMIVLTERNDTKVKSGRSTFTITGMQDGVQIFEVFFTSGAQPQVTLMGPFEGETYTQSFGNRGGRYRTDHRNRKASSSAGILSVLKKLPLDSPGFH